MKIRQIENFLVTNEYNIKILCLLFVSPVKSFNKEAYYDQKSFLLC